VERNGVRGRCSNGLRHIRSGKTRHGQIAAACQMADAAGIAGGIRLILYGRVIMRCNLIHRRIVMMHGHVLVLHGRLMAGALLSLHRQRSRKRTAAE